jgi:hypothetical protein
MVRNLQVGVIVAAALLFAFSVDADILCGGDICGQSQVHYKVDGDACVFSIECGNEHCVDGVCCDTSCTGTCSRCSSIPGDAVAWVGVNGTCSPMAAAYDPQNECGTVSCSSYYWGWANLTCYHPANVADGACSGAATCYAAADYCTTQGIGANTSLICDCGGAQVAGSCSGTTSGLCSNGFCASTGGGDVVSPPTTLVSETSTTTTLSYNQSTGFIAVPVEVGLNTETILSLGKDWSSVILLGILVVGIGAAAISNIIKERANKRGGYRG